MPDHIETVKSLAETYRSLAARDEVDKPDAAKRFLVTALALEASFTEMEESRERLRAVTNELGDLSDLPPEVIAELSVSKIDELEQQLRDIVASAVDGSIGLDTAIIEMYRRHRVVQPRRFIMNKLYRMAQKGLIHAVDGKKGVYTTAPAAARASRPFSFDDDPDLTDDVPF